MARSPAASGATTATASSLIGSSGAAIDWSTYSEDVPAVHEPLEERGAPARADEERLEAEAATAEALEAERGERDAAIADDNARF